MNIVFGALVISCISVMLTWLSSSGKVRNVCLRTGWHFCCAVLRRLLSDKCLQLTGMSSQKIPGRLSHQELCSSYLTQALYSEAFRLFCPFHIWCLHMNSKSMKCIYCFKRFLRFRSKNETTCHAGVISVNIWII